MTNRMHLNHAAALLVAIAVGSAAAAMAGSAHAGKDVFQRSKPHLSYNPPPRARASAWSSDKPKTIDRPVTTYPKRKSSGRGRHVK